MYKRIFIIVSLLIVSISSIVLISSKNSEDLNKEEQQQLTISKDKIDKLYVVPKLSNKESTFTDVQNNLYSNWRKNYLKSFSSNEELFVNTSDNSDMQTVSEAQGYGMLISVVAGENNIASAEKDFNDLYSYYLTQVNSSTNLMNWKQEITDNALSDSKENATDGDLYIAYSLIRAYKLWGNQDYKKSAETILNSILKYNYNEDLKILTLGSWVSKDSKEFQVFRSSDVIPMFFKEFRDFSKDVVWEEISNHMVSYVNDVSSSSKSGLVSDMIVVSNGKGTVPDGIVISSETDMQYSWSACRVPMQLYYGEPDTYSKEIVSRMMKFFETQPILYAGYDVDGNPTVDYSSIVFGGLLNFILEKDDSYSSIDTGYSYYIDNMDESRGYYGDTLFLISNIMD